MGCSIYFGSGLIPGGKENDKSRQAVFFTSLDPFGNNPDEEKHHDDYVIPQRKHTTKLIGNTIKMPYKWKHYPELKIKDCNSGKRSHLRSSPMTVCQEIAFTE